jgi:hypothetical protein
MIAVIWNFKPEICNLQTGNCNWYAAICKKNFWFYLGYMGRLLVYAGGKHFYPHLRAHLRSFRKKIFDGLCLG